MPVMRTLAAASLAAVLCGLAAAPAGAGSTRVVTIEDIDFTPAAPAIRRGDTVEWRFRDGSTPHNVRSRGTPGFRGSATKTTGTHRVRFTRAGTYRYVCTLHLNMRAKIVVR